MAKLYNGLIKKRTYHEITSHTLQTLLSLQHDGVL